MSVLECNRKGCESIMCDRYSYSFGYICESCFEEMVGIGTTNPEHIATFMVTSPVDHVLRIDVREYLEKVFSTEHR